jgi:hypothetical protein
MESTDMNHPYRMLKRFIQQGRSKRKPEAYVVRYVEGMSDARTPLEDLFSILPETLA